MKKIDLTKQQMNPCDEIILEDDHLNFAWELWFNVDSYFGTKTEGTDGWVNFYTNYYPDTDKIVAYYIVDLPEEYTEGDLELTREEEVFLRKLMEDYCKKEIKRNWDGCDNVLLDSYKFLMTRR